MILIHIWDPVHCVLRLAWRTAAAAGRLKPLLLTATLACTGITIVPPSPPVEAHSPPPPAQTIVTPPPGAPWGYPPAWGGVPPVGGGYAPYSRPIPLGPVLPAPGPQEAINHKSPGNLSLLTFVPDHIEQSAFPEAPPLISDTPLPPLCDVQPVVPASPVDEPGGALLLGMGLACLVLVRVQRAVEPSMRVTILSMVGK